VAYTDAELAANYRACFLPVREMTPVEIELARQRDAGLLTQVEYIAALNAL
jgi:hypothetical protein